MRWIKIAAATLNQTPLDWEGNVGRIRAAVDAAAEQGVQVLCLPELAVSGYGCEDAFHGIGHSRRAMGHLEAVAANVGEMVVVIGAAVRLPGGLFDCAAFLAQGRVQGFVGKQHLAGDGIHYEPRWFRAWPAGVVRTVEVGGREVPIGDVVFRVGDVRVGAEICEDAWVPNRPGARLALAGVDIVAGPSASHFAFGKARTRERLVAEGSRAFGCAYLFANALGNESGRAIFDGQRLVCAAGDVLARGELLSFAEWRMESAVVDLDLLRMKRDRTASLRTEESGVHFVDMDLRLRESDEAPTRTLPSVPAGWEGGAHAKEEEFARAVALALFDYLRKSRSRGFVVSLSGGADSAAVSILAALAYRFASRELGIAELKRRVPFVAWEDANWCGGILDTIYQGSANSGGTTRDAARALAEGIGARHGEWNIEEMAQHCRAMVEATLGRALNWHEDDIALQNVQARVRSPGAWMLANVRGALLLATSNRSEAAVGYATMDGDTSGSISPIAGVDKHWLRGWLQWMETTGPEWIGPLACLAAINAQAPTAELRPAESKQTDEADLMPYDVLDAIERLAVRDKMEPAEVLAALRVEWSARVGGEEALRGHVAKFFALWCRNQWKRERFAPSFHLDDESLDPKTWCRFPILSGGYAEELREM